MNGTAHRGGTARSRKLSLRTELLFNLAFLAASALLLAMVTAVLAPLAGTSVRGVVLLGLVIAGDVAVFIGFGRYLISRLVTDPIDALVEATEAVARGALTGRAPPADTRELDDLAGSVNRMTERLLDAQGALVRAEKLASVGRLAAGIAHEVGNPLAAAGNYLEVLRRRGADPEVVASTQRELSRIDGIVRGLLDYARPREAAREPLDIADVVAGAVELLRAQGVPRGVHLAFVPGEQAARVLGDRVALEQVFVNLLLNALDAAGEGGRIEVTTGATLPGAEAGAASAAEIIVADSGPGVPVELESRIFDPFFTTKEPGRGTGLGLAIVQRTVHDHGGRVDVRRAREGGAAFVVTLPAEQP